MLSGATWLWNEQDSLSRQYDPFETWCTCQINVWLKNDDRNVASHRPMRCHDRCSCRIHLLLGGQSFVDRIWLPSRRSHVKVSFIETTRNKPVCIVSETLHKQSKRDDGRTRFHKTPKYPTEPDHVVY